MPDSPDYQKYLPGSVRFSLQDLGELAARLGSVSNYDRRGEVVISEDFGFGLNAYGLTIVGANSFVNISANNASVTPYQVHMKAGPADTNHALLARFYGGWNTGRLGVEISVAINGGCKSFLYNVFRYNGASLIWSGIKIVPQTATPFYLQTSTGYVAVPGITNFSKNLTFFRQIKWVVDPATGKYVRLLLRGVEYDVSNLSASVSVNNLEASINLQADLICDGTLDTEAYLSRVIITSNEP